MSFKLMRVIPFLVLPFTSACRNNSEPQKVTTPQVIIEIIDVTANSETPLVTKPKLQDLTDEEVKVLDAVETFLKTYTGNGAYNYGSIDRFLAGLREDPKGIINDAREKLEQADAKRKTKQNNAKEKEKAESDYAKAKSDLDYAEKYGKKALGFFENIGVTNQVNKRGTQQIKEFLVEMGVDPKTADIQDDTDSDDANSDDADRIKKPLVTRDILLEFKKNAHALKRLIEREQLPGTKVAILNIDLKLVASVRKREQIVPDRVTLINLPSDSISLNK